MYDGLHSPFHKTSKKRTEGRKIKGEHIIIKPREEVAGGGGRGITQSPWEATRKGQEPTLFTKLSIPLSIVWFLIKPPTSAGNPGKWKKRRPETTRRGVQTWRLPVFLTSSSRRRNSLGLLAISRSVYRKGHISGINKVEHITSSHRLTSCFKDYEN